eukprot:2904789-Rhodomonas_salina.1
MPSHALTPARALCPQQFEMWGDGKQTRSFCYIDDAVEGLMRVMQSDYKEPLNVGELSAHDHVMEARMM